MLAKFSLLDTFMLCYKVLLMFLRIIWGWRGDGIAYNSTSESYYNNNPSVVKFIDMFCLRCTMKICFSGCRRGGGKYHKFLGELRINMWE